MATVTVRGLDEEVRRRLKVRAAANNRSMEAEARAILTGAVCPADPAEPAEPADPAGRPVAAPVTRVKPAGGRLTHREDRVAGLVAEGMTNRQIAAMLFLSERTVEGHVSTILRKLGFHRRSTVASWYVTRSSAP
ncbi:helix-turn-helix domain-containing protein [Ornithinimicrobium cerasi]|uniref:helix-turn-helix domain-containing protein n=1 Tax=Ornithinimicrobium cerasi TaxID=2248773 RepID=UPI00192A6139|nr:helix-turn-helix transcriptional regulator [Ornithinimicrobium cerasi]